MVLTAVAIFGEPLLGTRLGLRYRTRAADSTGLCAGLLSASWVLAGMAVQRQRHGQQVSVGIWLLGAMAGSGLAALWRVLPHLLGLAVLRQPVASDGSKMYAAKAAPWQLGLIAAGSVGVVAAAGCAAISEGGPLALLAVLLLGTASNACLHGVMRLLPRTFTVGEGLLLCQGTTMLAGAALWLGAKQLLRQQGDAGSPFPAFVSLLVFASIVMAAALIPLLLLAQKQQKPNNGHARQRYSQRQPPQQRAALAAAILVALLGAGAAVLPAQWLLCFAISTRQRRLVLAYWVVVMGAALPVMAWLAARGLPNILGRPHMLLP